MKKIRRYYHLIILTFIITIGFILRIYQVDSAPNGMLVDEPSIGYNAYSILKTGKDEFGNTFPMDFKAFGDHKLPAFIYATVPFISIFGLEIFSVRLTSVVIGTIIIHLIYLLLRKLSFNKDHSLIGAAITAVSPWTLMLSRFARESNLGLLFFILLLIVVAEYLHKKSKINIILISLFMAMTWYSYLPYRISTLILISVLGFYLLLQRKIRGSHILLFFFSFLLFISPLISVLTSSANTARFRQSSIISDSHLPVVIDEYRTFCVDTFPKLLCYLNANKLTSYIISFTNNFADIYSVKYLFLQGEAERFISSENFGQFPFFLLPLYLIGVYTIFAHFKKNNPVNLLLLSGAVSTTIPVALGGLPQLIRLSGLFPIILVVILIGWQKINHSNKIYLNSLLAICLIGFGFVYMFNYIGIHIPKYESHRSYKKELMKTLGSYNTSTPIYFTPLEFQEPIIYYAFHNKIDPTYYQNYITTGNVGEDGFQRSVQLNNLKITEKSLQEIYCEQSNALYVTPHNYSELEIDPIFVGKNDSGIHELAYIYDLSQINKPDMNCTEAR